MRNDQYFSHDATASNNIKLMTLMNEEGAKGYGIYWFLLEFLRQQKGYIGKMETLDILAKRVKSSRIIVQRVVTDYALFVVEEGQFYSPGLNGRMRSLDNKRATKSEQCRRAASNKWLKISDGKDAGAMQEEKRREEKRRGEERRGEKRISPPLPNPLPGRGSVGGKREKFLLLRLRRNTH